MGNSALVTAADRAGKQPQQGQPDHFDKLMESPCTNHAYLVKHLYKDCELLKCFLWQASKPKEGKGKEDVTRREARRARMKMASLTPRNAS